MVHDVFSGVEDECSNRSCHPHCALRRMIIPFRLQPDAVLGLLALFPQLLINVCGPHVPLQVRSTLKIYSCRPLGQEPERDCLTLLLTSRSTELSYTPFLLRQQGHRLHAQPSGFNTVKLHLGCMSCVQSNGTLRQRCPWLNILVFML